MTTPGDRQPTGAQPGGPTPADPQRGGPQDGGPQSGRPQPGGAQPDDSPRGRAQHGDAQRGRTQHSGTQHSGPQPDNPRRGDPKRGSPHPDSAPQADVQTLPPASARHLAWLFSPPRQRRVLEALCGIEGEINASLRPGIDHHVAHTRLQWWREECARTAQGRPLHPLTRELLEAYAPASPDALRGLSGFVDIATWDLAAATFETRRELTAYCERWSAAMIEAAAATIEAATATVDTAGHAVDTAAPTVDTAAPTVDTTAPTVDTTARTVDTTARRVETPALTIESRAVIGTAAAPFSANAPAASAPQSSRPSTPHMNSPSGSNAWRTIGVAIREIEMLCCVAREADQGRLRVPLDELERAGVAPEDVRSNPSPDALAALLRNRHEVLRASLVAGVAGIPPEQRPQTRGLIVWASAAWRMSRRAQRMLPRMITPQPFAALGDTWYAWRAARHAMMGRSVLKPT